MVMPKGFKTRNGYFTTSDTPGGLDYRNIAEKMTSQGDKMNHSTARNVLVSAMMKLAKPIHELYQLDASHDAVKKTAIDPGFQMGIFDILDEYGMKELKNGTRKS